MNADIVTWVNGDFVAAGSPQVAPSAYGVTIGEGLFETFAVYSGRIFALDLHLARLATSAAALQMTVPGTSELRLACLAVAQELAGHSVARLRLTVTSGPAGLGVLGAPSVPDIMVLGSATPSPQLGSINTKRASLVTSQWRRNEFSAVTGHKVTSYYENALALRAAAAVGGDEALLLNSAGFVSEGATSNLLFDASGQLVTPSLRAGGLPGVTRALVLQWSRLAGLPIVEVDGLTPGALAGAPAALLGTLRNVQEVASLDGAALASSPLIRRVQELFAENMTALLDHS